MARVPRPKPARLPEKLLQIRLALGLSQGEMVRSLELNNLTRTTVSAYEVGTSEPPLPVLLKYARSVGVSTDVLIDDELNLPGKLPTKQKRK
ncbi:MAG: helix-turn-helix transcriptional regulator [Pyrinomonadaceae bacterium]